MQVIAQRSWRVTLATMTAFGPLTTRAVHAANVGAWAPVGGWITGLIALAWLLCVAILVFGVVQFLMGLTTYREEGLGHGMVKGAAVIVGAVIAFFIVPPLVEAGVALGATLR